MRRCNSESLGLAILLTVCTAMPAAALPDVTLGAAYSEAELDKMIVSGGAQRQQAVGYILAHPETVHPFSYSYVVEELWAEGNRAQASFWFYIFQSRTGSWAKADTAGSGDAALRASLNEAIGGKVNAWIGSDLDAMHDLVERALSYERRFPRYAGKPRALSDAAWTEIADAYRRSYAEQFEAAYASMSSDKKGHAERRSRNGLYVGPWQNPGAPLPEAWR